VILNAPCVSNSIPPPQEHQPHVEPFPYSLVASSSSPGESLNTSNQEAQKKKKRKNKKKKNKQGGNQPTTDNHLGSVDDIYKYTNTSFNPKFPYRICKGDHLLKHFPGIPKVLEVRSQVSQQPMLPSTVGHVGCNPSTNNHQVGGKKGQVNIPCWLCREMHCTYLSPRMDEAFNYWNTFLFPNNNLQLLPMNLIPTNHWFMKW
jgi:hypothetical protein